MIKRHLRKLLLASAVTLLPIAFGLICWYELPPMLTTHWGVSGEADGFAPKAFAVFGLPLILLAVFWLCVFVTAKDPKNKEQNDKPMGVVIWSIPLISCVANGVVYAVTLGASFNGAMLMGLVLGLMFVLIGNYLPKCKQNFTLGIKIRPTLESEENWNATHRLAGKLWFFGGFAVMLCALLPETAAFAVIMVLIGIYVAVPVIYSYALRRRQLQSTNNDVHPLTVTKCGKTVRAVSIVMVVLILVGTAVLMVTGDVAVAVGETSFEVKATYWDDITVPYADVDRVEYREKYDFGTRINGFGSARLLLGIFENDEFGAYTLYAYTASDDAIVLHDDNRVLVIAAKDDAQTKALYDALTQKIQ